MSFWDKLESFADKLAKGAEKLENAGNNFLDKHFSEENERQVFSSYELLNLTKTNIQKIAGAKLLSRIKLIRSEAHKLNGDVSIATSTIEQLKENPYSNLGDFQYRVQMKGLVSADDAYGALAGSYKFDLCIVIDQYSEYTIEQIKVVSRW